MSEFGKDDYGERSARLHLDMRALFETTDPGKILRLEHRVRCLERELREARGNITRFGNHLRGCPLVPDPDDTGWGPERVCTCGFEKMRGILS